MVANQNDMVVRILSQYVPTGTEQAITHMGKLKVILNSVTSVSKDMIRGYQDMGNQILNSQKAVSDFSKTQGTFYADINKKVNEFGTELSNVGSTSTMVSKDFQGAFKDIGSQVMGAQKQQGSYWDTYFKNNKHATRLTDQFSGKIRNLGDVHREAFKKIQRPFAGYAMSIMFAGMALQRYSMQLYKFGTKAFQEISHSIEGTTTNTDMLEGSMKYLGFVVGQALEPLIGWLIPIIDKVAEWTEKNPKLTATIVALGVGLGTLFMVGGMGVLAINGFIDLAAKIGLMSSSAISGGTQVTSLGSRLKNLGHTLRPGGTLMTAMGAGLAIAAVLRMFGKDWINKTPTVKDWLTNLGMTTAAGFMIGGVPGALVGFTIGAFLMVSQETIKGALKQIENFARAQQAIQEKFARGEILTAEEAYKINFQGTVLPAGYQDKLKQEIEDFGNTILEGSAIWQEEQRKQKENMQSTIRGEYSGSAYEQVYGNTYYIDTIKIEDPQAIESLNNLTKLAGG